MFVSNAARGKNIISNPQTSDQNLPGGVHNKDANAALLTAHWDADTNVRLISKSENNTVASKLHQYDHVGQSR